MGLQAAIARAWREGRLDYKLDPHQLDLHKKYRRWVDATDGIEVDPEADTMPLVFVADIGRRWGKTWLFVLIKFEDCIRQPGSIHTYAAAFGKDITEIVIPLADEIADDAPAQCAPRFRTSTQGQSMAYRFPNGSVLRLVGIDVNPRGLRGRASDGFAISEGGHVRDLENTARGVILPQFQRKPHARLVIESNAPEDVDHDFDTTFVRDAKDRACASCADGNPANQCVSPDGLCAYQFGTIDDNLVLSEQEKNVHLANAGGRSSPRCRREYYGERIMDRERMIVPEWDADRHVRKLELPTHAICVTALDPGSRDHTAILWAMILFELGVLYVQRSWAKGNAGTPEIAAAIRDTEAQLWGGLRWWSVTSQSFRDNPVMRTSDVNPRLRQDLANEFRLNVAPVNKTGGAGGLQAELKEASVNSFRAAVQKGQIIAAPEAQEFIAQMSAGRWNEQHTDYERTKRYGHFDAIDCGVVLWRTAKPYLGRNPYPPATLDLPPSTYNRHDVPQEQPKVAAALESIGGAPRNRRWQRDGGRLWRR